MTLQAACVFFPLAGYLFPLFCFLGPGLLIFSHCQLKCFLGSDGQLNCSAEKEFGQSNPPAASVAQVFFVKWKIDAQGPSGAPWGVVRPHTFGRVVQLRAGSLERLEDMLEPGKFGWFRLLGFAN